MSSRSSLKMLLLETATRKRFSQLRKTEFHCSRPQDEHRRLRTGTASMWTRFALEGCLDRSRPLYLPCLPTHLVK